MLDWVWYSIFNIRFECWIEFDIRYSTFKNWMWDWVWYSIFDIRFECWIEFDIRYSTFDLNVGLSLIFDIRHSIWMLDWVWYSIFDIQNLNVECWISNIEPIFDCFSIPHPPAAYAAVRSKAVVMLLLLYCFMYLPLLLEAPCWSLFWCALLCVVSSFAIILSRKRERAGCFYCLSDVLLL